MYWNPDMKKLEIYSWDLDKLMMSAFNSSDELKKLLSTDAKSKSEHNLPPIYSPKGLLLYKNHSFSHLERVLMIWLTASDNPEKGTYAQSGDTVILRGAL